MKSKRRRIFPADSVGIDSKHDSGDAPDSSESENDDKLLVSTKIPSRKNNRRGNNSQSNGEPSSSGVVAENEQLPLINELKPRNSFQYPQSMRPNRNQDFNTTDTFNAQQSRQFNSFPEEEEGFIKSHPKKVLINPDLSEGGAVMDGGNSDVALSSTRESEGGPNIKNKKGDRNLFSGFHRPMDPSNFTGPTFENNLNPDIAELSKDINARPYRLGEIVSPVLKKMRWMKKTSTGMEHELMQEVQPTINGHLASEKAEELYDTSPTGQKTMKKQLTVLDKDQMSIMLLHLARCGDDSSLSLLTSIHNLDYNIADDEGRTAVIYAAIGNHHKCLSILLKNGALVGHLDCSGRTALHWACYYGSKKTAKLLLEYEADMYQKDFQKKTSLHCATYPENSCTLKLMLKKIPLTQGVDYLDEDNMTPLMWAAFYGNVDNVKMLLKRRPNCAMKDIEGKTALHWAACCKHNSCCSVLLKNDPSLATQKDNQGRVPLHIACGEGNSAITEILLQSQNTKVGVRDGLRRTPLHWASVRGHVSCVKLLCDRGINVNKVDSCGATALHYAAENNYSDCVHVLIEFEADADIRDENGRTPLLWACAVGHLDVIKLLLDANVQVDIRDNQGLTALHMTAYNGHISCCVLLARKGADFDAVDLKKHSPLFKAAIAGYADVIIALINEGASVNNNDVDGRYPIHWAANAGHADVVNILLSHGANPNCTDNQNTYPIHEAAYQGNDEVVVCLLDRGAYVDVKDEAGYASLHRAAANGHLETCKVLITHGADVNILSAEQEGKTPLDMAIENEHFNCVKYLQSMQGMCKTDLYIASAIKIQRAWRNSNLPADQRKKNSKQKLSKTKSPTSSSTAIPKAIPEQKSIYQIKFEALDPAEKAKLEQTALRIQSWWRKARVSPTYVPRTVQGRRTSNHRSKKSSAASSFDGDNEISKRSKKKLDQMRHALEQERLDMDREREELEKKKAELEELNTKLLNDRKQLDHDIAKFKKESGHYREQSSSKQGSQYRLTENDNVTQLIAEDEAVYQKKSRSKSNSKKASRKNSLGRLDRVETQDIPANAELQHPESDSVLESGPLIQEPKKRHESPPQREQQPLTGARQLKQNEPPMAFNREKLVISKNAAESSTIMPNSGLPTTSKPHPPIQVGQATQRSSVELAINATTPPSKSFQQMAPSNQQTHQRHNNNTVQQPQQAVRNQQSINLTGGVHQKPQQQGQRSIASPTHSPHPPEAILAGASNKRPISAPPSKEALNKLPPYMAPVNPALLPVINQPPHFTPSTLSQPNSSQAHVSSTGQLIPSQQQTSQSSQPGIPQPQQQKRPLSLSQQQKPQPNQQKQGFQSRPQQQTKLEEIVEQQPAVVQLSTELFKEEPAALKKYDQQDEEMQVQQPKLSEEQASQQSVEPQQMTENQASGSKLDSQPRTQVVQPPERQMRPQQPKVQPRPHQSVQARTSQNPGPQNIPTTVNPQQIPQQQAKIKMVPRFPSKPQPAVEQLSTELIKEDEPETLKKNDQQDEETQVQQPKLSEGQSSQQSVEPQQMTENQASVSKLDVQPRTQVVQPPERQMRPQQPKVQPRPHQSVQARTSQNPGPQNIPTTVNPQQILQQQGKIKMVPRFPNKQQPNTIPSFNPENRPQQRQQQSLSKINQSSHSITKPSEVILSKASLVAKEQPTLEEGKGLDVGLVESLDLLENEG